MDSRMKKQKGKQMDKKRVPNRVIFYVPKGCVLLVWVKYWEYFYFAILQVLHKSVCLWMIIFDVSSTFQCLVQNVKFLLNIYEINNAWTPWYIRLYIGVERGLLLSCNVQIIVTICTSSCLNDNSGLLYHTVWLYKNIIHNLGCILIRFLLVQKIKYCAPP